MPLSPYKREYGAERLHQKKYFFETDNITLVHQKMVSSLRCYINLWPHGFRSFNLPLRVLFSFRSHYYYAIGLETYLGLEANASQIHAWYPTHTPPDILKSPYSLSPKGLSPSMAVLSSTLRIVELRCKRVQNTTSPLTFEKGFSLPYTAFDRL